MNVHFTYKLGKSPKIEEYLQSQIEKLGPRLHVFNPDMVSLRGLIEEAPKSGFTVALNLRLPAGQMAARASAETLHAAIRISFEDLTEQLRKHKEHLRSQYRYPRVRGSERHRIEPQVAFESTVAAVRPEAISSGDVTGFVNANLERLHRYIERELRFRRDSGQRRLAEVSAEEVIDEVIASALDEHRPRPEKIALEPWLYRLSRSAMDRLGNQLESGPKSVRLNDSELHPVEDIDGEEMMQFYHPDESLTNENLIADHRGSTPEDDASRDELMGMVERALRRATKHQREAFLLFTMEGFRLTEIAAITERTAEQVQADVTVAREHLRRSLINAGERRQKLVNNRMQGRSA
ncbi:MAG TPA: HPF/RaiA family ribosome-associated protein [Candidatus Saccharimonadales bacterium]|nr:HPF/RaiA family ribosome-associated protein [Candidatus Saccharimonadales bacterium]